ncbi:MAG: hypothetical protein ACOC4F_03375 [bacterium]
MNSTAMKRNTGTALVALASALFLALSSCSHEVGLFASLEQEIPVDEERGFPNDGSIHSLERSGERYFAGGSTLWVRNATDDSASDLASWDRIAPPSSGLTLASMALVGSELYAVYGQTLYSRAANGNTAAEGWDPVNDFDSTAVSRVFGVEVDGTPDFVVSAPREDEAGERLLASNGDEVPGLGESDNRNTIYGVANFGSEIYVLTGTQLLSIADNLSVAATEVPIPESASSSFRDIRVRGADSELWVAGKGKIYVATDPTDEASWESTTELTPEDASSPAQFLTLDFVTVGGSEYVLAGTESDGLYEGVASDFPTLSEEGSGGVLIGRNGNYLTTEIPGGNVEHIVVDESGSARGEDGPLVFLGARGRGLWRGQPANGDFIWRRE